eukprot:6857736-Alexandrium_andersonii.AAC.1
MPAKREDDSASERTAFTPPPSQPRSFDTPSPASLPPASSSSSPWVGSTAAEETDTATAAGTPPPAAPQ